MEEAAQARLLCLAERAFESVDQALGEGDVRVAPPANEPSSQMKRRDSDEPCLQVVFVKRERCRDSKAFHHNHIRGVGKC